MKIILGRIDNENIYSSKDYRDIKDCGEVAYMLMEIKLIERDLIEIWEDMQDENR